MGVLHNFQGLQAHGKKLVKFKQDVLIDRLVERKDIPPTMLHLQVGGACAAYTMMWLYTRINGMLPLSRSKGVKYDERNYEFAKIGANVQNLYVKDFVPEEWHKRTIALFAEFDLTFTLDPEEKTSFGKLFSAGASIIPHRPGAYLSVSYKSGQSHAVAFHGTKEDLHFFDPNIGEYQIVDIGGFFKEYFSVTLKIFKRQIVGGHVAAVDKKGSG